MEDTGLTDSATGGNAPHAVTKNGSVARSSTQKKYGDYSAVFDGDTDSLQFEGDSDFAHGTDDFTWECWVYPSVSSSAALIMGNYNSTGTGAYAMLYQSGDWRLFWDTSAGTLIITGYGYISQGVWYHVAVVRDSGTFRLYIDGTQRGTSATSLDLNSTDRDFYIGSDQNGSWDINGYIDEVRVSTVCRYPDGTPFIPSGPFPPA